MMYIEADRLSDGIYNIKDGEIFKYKAKGGTVRTYKIANMVHCKECKRWWGNHYHDNEDGKCPMDAWIDGDGFCSYGEREGE